MPSYCPDCGARTDGIAPHTVCVARLEPEEWTEGFGYDSIPGPQMRAYPVPVQAEIEELRAALQALYDLLPRYSCKASEPDGCPVCVARALLKGDR